MVIYLYKKTTTQAKQKGGAMTGAGRYIVRCYNSLTEKRVVYETSNSLNETRFLLAELERLSYTSKCEIYDTFLGRIVK